MIALDIDPGDIDPLALDFVTALGAELHRIDPEATQLHALDAALSVVLVGKPKTLCILAICSRLTGLLRTGDGEVRQAAIAGLQLLLGGALNWGDELKGQRH